MHFSTRAEYGLEAVINLAEHYPRLRTIKNISSEEQISPKYLEKLFGILRRGGIIKSYKGKKGGYILARSSRHIRVGKIIELLEGSISPMKQVCNCCTKQKTCASSSVWIMLGHKIRKALYEIKLSDLCKK